MNCMVLGSQGKCGFVCKTGYVSCGKQKKMRRSFTYILTCLFSVTCVFEGSLNDVIMAQHAKS